MRKIVRNREQKENLSSQAVLLVLTGLLAALLFSILASITFGNADISIKEVYSVVFYELFHVKSLAGFSQGAIHDVVWIIRFPRVILALAVGMGLSVCGVIMQAIVKNPIADPYVLGVSSGASLGATAAVLFGVGYAFGASSVGVMAFAGAMMTSFLVLFISNTGGASNAAKLVLVGMAVSAVCSAFVSFSIYLANDQSANSEIMFWMLGSLAGAKWRNVVVILPLMILGTLVFWTQFRNLNLMLLGDEVSITLGTNLRRLRSVYMIVASLMVGFAVYAAGTIGFVGLIIPHAVRMVFGTDHKRMIPICALVGGIFLIWADVLCRIILKNSELPIGILVSLIGTPCFLWMIVKRSYGFGGGGS